MQRREFLRSAVVGAAAVKLGATGFGQAAAVPPVPVPEVKRVLVVFKCHLDVGFTDTQANVMSLYFKKYYPTAIETAARSRQAGRERYVWTTGSWLLYEYLEQANAAERKQMEEAVAHGDIAYHALPFSWQTELMDRSMISGCLGFATTLDRRFGLKTIAGKMTDVPGHSRGIVAPLAAGGIRLLDVGVNAASTPPDVPDVFLWKAPDGSSVMVLYHKRNYGSTVRVLNSDLAISVQVRDDNGGPHTPEEIAKIYATLKAQFPNATIEAGNLSQVATALSPLQQSLPIVTGEIGDTWIYGAPSDPPKTARFREVSRLRREWITAGSFAVGDKTDLGLLRRTALAAEHTWGTDTKRYIDHEHYAPKDLALYLDKPNYQVMEHSWQEKRDDIDDGLKSLPPALQTQAKTRLDGLVAIAPSTAGMKRLDLKETIHTAHYDIGFDPATGALNRFKNLSSGQEWASAQHPLAGFSYQTLSAPDYVRFLAAYVRAKEWWAPQDFGKPNVDKTAAESKTWGPILKELWSADQPDALRILAVLAIEDVAAEQKGLVAWPAKMYLELTLPKAEAKAHLTFYALGKAPNRMPEALWLSFHPQTNGVPKWSMNKVDQAVDAEDVLKGGGRRMHGVSDRMTCRDSKHSLEVHTLDAPVVAFAPASPLNFSEELPDQRDGAHVSLFNNAWGTNYPQWAGGDWKYRFTLIG